MAGFLLEKGGYNMNTVLFSGVHGVGKGYFLERIESDILDYEVCSASQLIAKYRTATDAGYKRIKDVRSNQDLLINAINDISFDNSKGMILDGHLCILNAKDEIKRIPLYFFENVKISGVIILQDRPDIINERIFKRDGKNISIGKIKEIQENEQKYAKKIQIELGIKYIIISHECTGKQFVEYLEILGGEE